MEVSWLVLDRKGKREIYRNDIPVTHQKQIKVSVAIQEGKEK
jgi:hypothetical protein